jgi:hypothetical protein
MPAPIYTVFGSGISLSASTAKTVLGAKTHANSGLIWLKVHGSFNSVTAADQPVLVELMYTTWATNAPATNSTSVTPTQLNGRVITAGFTGAKTWTSEPTALTQIDAFYVPPNGTFLYDFPLGNEPDAALGEGFSVRCTPGSSATSMSFGGAIYVSRS